MPSLDEVLKRAADYVSTWVPQLANIVSTEAYAQTGRVPGSTATRRLRLKSDVLLVRYPGGDLTWMLFRDVAETNGKPLAHAPERLLTLFAEAPADAKEQAQRIATEGVHYHLPGATASATNPFLVVALMHEFYQPRLRFRLGDVDRNTLALRFEERAETGAVDGRNGERLPLLLPDVGRVRGTVWLDVETGRIVKTEGRMSLYGLAVSSTSTTTFALDQRLAVMLPTEMHTTWGAVSGTAKYSNYRRFNVGTTETPILKPLRP